MLDSLDRQERPAAAPAADNQLIGSFDEYILKTLNKTWGTRAESQTVAQAGGALNLVPLAQAILARFDDPPQLVVVADGNGDPVVTEQGLAGDLAQRFIGGEVLIVEPTFESALGLFKPGEFSLSRRRFLLADTPRLLKMLASGMKGRTAGHGSGAVELLNRLGIEMPGACHDRSWSVIESTSSRARRAVIRALIARGPTLMLPELVHMTLTRNRCAATHPTRCSPDGGPTRIASPARPVGAPDAPCRNTPSRQHVS